MTLTESDYLTYQLYTASKNPLVKRSRIRNWKLTTVLCFLTSYLFFGSSNAALGWYFSIAGTLCLILYPFYSRWRYRRHYLSYVRQNYASRVGIESSIELTDDAILMKDRTGELKIYKSEVMALNEIADYFFIRVKTGCSLIIPERQIAGSGVTENDIRALGTQQGVRHNVDLDWKWK